MKYLKLFENHQTEAEVAEICKTYGIENWSLNKDGLVDIDGDVSLVSKNLESIPLKFGHVTGFFDLDKNYLTSLKGSPHTVGDYFSCDNNKLTSLEFSPKSVTSFFWCEKNNIRSFEGLENIGEYFYCIYNPVYEIWKIINLSIDQTTSMIWDSEKMEFFNDLDIIRGEEIAIERFNFFLEEMGLSTVEKVEGYKNIY